ncbi:MAPEG family protein [Luteimonas sp. MC1750]|uniref:MAPEG family protein n=1 Tax=Luteimonas sp. MC1750 TaxID=2799326 RepID=UPI0018F063C1|nr:MAPEG family protein [Luteimonas sp. MC1750]MBJ6985729.1 MAPEG family protein [Luteimonas sp. MC1750]QQO06072.1 MAPEG family protein [Luteimonas sp. MC1750]
MTLATAYGCILIAALLPYIWVAVAKTGAPGYNNRNPRAWIAKQAGNYRVQRANAAHLNAFEAFAPFAAGVLMAQAAGVDHARIAMLAVAFVVVRVAHGALYLADVQLARSLAWMAGYACVVALMVLAALAAS